MEKSESVANLIQFVVDSVRQAPADDAPFHHLQFDRIFPDDFYAQMLEAMPVGEDYRAMSGKSKMGSTQARWKTHPREDRSFSRIRSPFTAEKTRSLGCDRSRAAFQGVAICFRPTVGAGTERPVRRKLRKGEHVSGTDPDARHSRLPYLQAYRQSLERDHRPILSTGGQFHAAHRHDLPRGVAEWTQTEKGTDAVFAEYRLRVRRSRQHLAFGRPGRAGGENARQHSPHLFRRCRAVAICSQSRASAGEFCAQRGAQFKAQLGRQRRRFGQLLKRQFASFVMLSEAQHLWSVSVK